MFPIKSIYPYKSHKYLQAIWLTKILSSSKRWCLCTLLQTNISGFIYYIWFMFIAGLFPSFWIILLILDLKCEMLKMLALEFCFVTFIKLIVIKFRILLVYVLYITHNLWKDLSWRFDISFLILQSNLWKYIISKISAFHQNLLSI